MKVMGLLLVVGVVMVGCTSDPDASIGTASSSTPTKTTTSSVPSSTAGTSAAAPSTVTVRSTVTSTVVETVVVDTTPILTHTGFGAIQLRMTREEVLATGLVDGQGVVRGSSGCDLYRFKSGTGTVWIQDGQGVMAIGVDSGARTAEGLPVEIDARDPRVARTYPGGEMGPNGFSVWVKDDVFYFFSGGTSLVRRGQACFN